MQYEVKISLEELPKVSAAILEGEVKGRPLVKLQKRSLMQKAESLANRDSVFLSMRNREKK